MSGPTKVFGFVNHIHVSGPVKASGGGLGRVLLGLVALVALGAVLAAGYDALAAGLEGVRESTHAANVAAAWTIGGGAGLALVLAGAGVLIYRRRQACDEPMAATFTAQVDRALIAQRNHATRIAPAPAARALPASSPTVHATARCLDRVEPVTSGVDDGSARGGRPLDLDALGRGDRAC